VILPDVNVLVYAYRADAPGHQEYRAWLSELVNRPAPFALSDHVLGGVLRVVTHPRIFKTPTPTGDILTELQRLRSRSNCVVLRPGARHWPIFTDLVTRVGAKGNVVPDAYLAALAIESGSEWATADRGFARFPGLRWRHPLDPSS
jgi:uncharacterized protein